ncbi:hypothetical protein E2562_007754 [Oryza meyeriana var. granulata]|uniref:Uncharacterized protein n=1 Tax=Oryza meyeriana var. granulata TaxID=110450 RepID=A0A6G1EIY0_9ORYZ|nr:hypothetical protein E2562_007754 [Oryza meyeriana var. granulata]
MASLVDDTPPKGRVSDDWYYNLDFSKEWSVEAVVEALLATRLVALCNPSRIITYNHTMLLLYLFYPRWPSNYLPKLGHICPLNNVVHSVGLNPFSLASLWAGRYGEIADVVRTRGRRQRGGGALRRGEA